MTKKAKNDSAFEILEGMDFNGPRGGELARFRRAVSYGDATLPGMGQAKSLAYVDDYMAVRARFAREAARDNFTRATRKTGVIVVGGCTLFLGVGFVL